MKRVLLTVHKFFPAHKAGTETLALNVAKELINRGYSVQVLTANPPDNKVTYKDGPATSRYTYEGVPIIAIEESARLENNNFTNEFYNPHLKKYFQTILAEFSPDLVHCFHLQNLSASLIECCHASEIPVVFSATDFWLICPVVQLKRPDRTICEGPAPAGINCLTCYTPKLFPPYTEVKQALSNKYPAIDNFLNKLPHLSQDLLNVAISSSYIASKLPAAAHATMVRPHTLCEFANSLRAITVPTMLMQRLFVEHGINSSLIHHVPFGIDVSALEKHQVKSRSEDLRIGFIGTLFEHKGVDLLIKAFHTLPENSKASLKIYGSEEQFPEYATDLKALAAKGQNAKKISFLGTFPNSEFGPILSNLDILVVPSRWYENTPLVIQSALSTKTPVVATNLGGMSELIKHERNGLLFTLNSFESLAEQLQRLLKEPDLLTRLRDNIAPEHSTEKMVDQFECLYQKSINIQAAKVSCGV